MKKYSFFMQFINCKLFKESQKLKNPCYDLIENGIFSLFFSYFCFLYKMR